MLHTHKKIGKFLFFGGHIELDEHPWQAMVREIKEETGYDMKQLRLLQPKKRVKNLSSGRLVPYPISVMSVGYYGDHDTNHYHDDLTYAFVTDEVPKNNSFEGESGEIKLFTSEEVAALTDNQVVPATRELAQFVFDECLKNWEQVPVETIKS